MTTKNDNKKHTHRALKRVTQKIKNKNKTQECRKGLDVHNA